MNKTEKMSTEQFKQHNAAKAGNKSLGLPWHHVQDNGNLHPGIKPHFWIGLDPGLQTGFALWKSRVQIRPGEYVEVNTLTFVATVRRLEKLAHEFGPAALRARVETPQGNKPTFDKDVAPTEANMKKREKMSQNVGSNKRDAQLLLDFLTDIGIPFDAVVPTGNGGKAGKVQQDFFLGIKGFPSKSSQHARDAAKLVLNL